MSKNKSQVTLFIIIGIIILLVAVLSIIMSNYLNKNILNSAESSEQQFTLESNAIKENIDNCIQTYTDKGIQLMAYQGFYLEMPDSGFKYDSSSSYWLKDTITIMPYDFAKFEYDLSSYINANIKSCFSFDKFSSMGWSISTFNPATRLSIYEQDILVEVNYTITVKKSDFERQFSNSIYNPKIRFKQLYIKSADFVNNQLLKPEFDFNNPLKDYDSAEYVFSSKKVDDKTIIFSIADPKSKKLDGKDFTARFAASFDINSVPRTYDVSSYLTDRILYSPDRLAMLILPAGTKSSSNEITIRQYESGSVTRSQTPIGKLNKKFIGYKDVEFATSYPIYRFSPKGTKFSSPAILIINLNKDQHPSSEDLSLLVNGIDGWLPYPNKADSGNGIIGSVIFGFN